MLRNRLSYQSLILLATGTLVVLGAIGIYYLSRPTQIALTPTKEISSEQSIGGAQKTPSASDKSSEPSPDKTETTPNKTSPQPAPTPKPTEKAVLPEEPSRLARIADSIKVEYPYRALDSLVNDPYYAQSLSSSRTGVTNAWKITTGSPVVVAVIDTGFALEHEDLKNSWYQNPGEIGTTTSTDRCWNGTAQDKSTNACDDDNNGYIDDWRGWNFYGLFDSASGKWVQNNNPIAGAINPDGQALSHGTQTAGLVGATTNNGVGVASANWNTQIMPLQALGDDGDGSTSSVVYAIYYAADNGAKIINMSLGGPDDDPALQQAIDYAYSKGVLVVAAAGNCGTGTEPGCDPAKPGAMGYPALDNHVVAVGATDANDARASFSSFGPGVDVVAPGSGTIISPMIDQSVTPHNMTSAYAGGLYGTSFASPTVAGVASLIVSLRPTASPDDMLALIDGAARKVTGMNGAYFSDQYGHGVVAADTGATIAKSLITTSSAPTLRQTGNYISEHSVNTTSKMASGCELVASAYCTVRFSDETRHYDRFLPYQLSNTSGQAGWSWPGSFLTTGNWDATAVSGGNMSSNPYILFWK